MLLWFRSKIKNILQSNISPFSRLRQTLKISSHAVWTNDGLFITMILNRNEYVSSVAIRDRENTCVHDGVIPTHKRPLLA